MIPKFNFRDFQSEVDNWIKSHGGYWPPLSMLSALVEEVGEIARAINIAEGFKPPKENERPKLSEEVADTIFAIICIANYYNIDLSKELANSLLKYSKRDADRFKLKK
jgi:NTP pyrophosphatase (non-canonical NTP hydrolase)